MAEGPVRCPACGQSDFFVISTGVAYRGGTIIERYRWPETEDEQNELDDVLHEHLYDEGYHVEQETLEEPEMVEIEGPVKAFCAQCLADRTDQYLSRRRAESLPV